MSLLLQIWWKLRALAWTLPWPYRSLWSRGYWCQSRSHPILTMSHCSGHNEQGSNRLSSVCASLYVALLSQACEKCPTNVLAHNILILFHVLEKRFGIYSGYQTCQPYSAHGVLTNLFKKTVFRIVVFWNAYSSFPFTSALAQINCQLMYKDIAWRRL